MGELLVTESVLDTTNQDRNPVVLYILSLSSGSRKTQTVSLAKIAAFLGGTIETVPWEKLTITECMAVRGWIAKKRSAPTANRYLCALRGTLLCAHRLGLMTYTAYRSAIDFPNVRGGRTDLAGRAVSAEELTTLFAACREQGVIGTRNAALLAFLYGCGLRRTEVVSLNAEDLDPTDGKATVRGKGNKTRVVFIPPTARGPLERWLEMRGNTPGPLFLRTHGGRPDREIKFLAGKRLGSAAVLMMVRTLARKAQIPRCTVHDLRRTYIGDLLDLGADISTIQRLVGHESVSTTAKYDRRAERVRKAAAHLIQIPC